MILPKINCCMAFCAIVSLSICSAARHEMFHSTHPLIAQPLVKERASVPDIRQHPDNEAKQWICSVHDVSCDRVVQSCSSSGCVLVDILPPYSCIIHMQADSAHQLLASGIVASAVVASTFSRPPSIAHPLLQLLAPIAASSFNSHIDIAGVAMTIRCLPGAVSAAYHKLVERLPSSCRVSLQLRSSASSSFGVTVPAECYQVFLNAAAAVPAIFSVFHRERFKTKNRWTRGIIQSRSKDTSFWNSNITGRDQVVAIGDTGVDTGLGFFHDELNPVPYCTDSPSCNSVRPHRRFKAYIELSGGDRRDDDGHGSHTTASIAGKAHCIGMYSGEQSDQQLYNGMAPDAKIIFSDISNDETLGGLPENLDTDYFPLPFNLGARIRSDSWGTSDAFYTDSSRDFDSFAFHHDEFLPLIAAGNDGDTGLFSVGAPATAKNCIAVGATGNAEDSFSFLPDHDFGIRVDTSAATSCDASPPFPLISAHPAGFGPAFPAELRDWHIAISSPLDACSTLHGTDFSGKIVLIVRGTCTFVEKVRAAANAGAAGALIYNNEDGLIRMGGSGDDIKIPSASIIRQAGSQLSCIIGSGVAFSIALPLPAPVSRSQGPDFVAAFSSLGPTLDGRLKPDLMAPGEYVFSAKASPTSGPTPPGYCAPLSSPQTSIKAIMGTSMAAPTLAGGAVLLRQWLVEGRYPDGMPKPSAAKFSSPSGALIKALLINSALPLTGRTPNIYEGYGAAILDDAVPLLSSVVFSMIRGRLWADDRVVLPTTFSAYTVTVDVVETSVPLVATLVWWDAPVSTASQIILANDFDITCFPPKGAKDHVYVYTGNGYTVLDVLGTVHQVSDRMNSNERVFIRSPSIGTYVCSVTLERQLMTGSSFAVVITGGFGAQPVSQILERPPCTASCVHGRCSNSSSVKLSPSACVCDIGWTGIVCSVPVSRLSLSSKSSVTLPLDSETWQYFWFIVPPSASLFSVSFSRSGTIGDPDFFLQQAVPPSVSSWVAHDTRCDSCSETPKPPSVLLVDSSSYQKPLPGLWFAGVFASCCSNTSATLSLRVSSTKCQGNDEVLGCDGSCAKAGDSIVDYDPCGVCGGNGSTCYVPFVPTPPSPQQNQPASNPPGAASKEVAQLLVTIGGITVAVIYYMCSACVSLLVFVRVRGSARPVRLPVASFLWCLFGLTGAHRFYTKHTITGFVWLFTCGLGGVGWIVDLFLLQKMITRYNVHGSRLPKFFQGMQNRLRNRVGKNRYRKTTNFVDDDISLEVTGLEATSENHVFVENVELNPVDSLQKPRIFDGTVEVGGVGANTVE